VTAHHGSNLIRIFLVDDHPILTEVLSDALRESGRFEVMGTAQTGEEALDRLEEKEVDILVLDVTLPDISGLEIAGRLVARETSPKIVFLTGNTSERTLVELSLIGASAIVEKSMKLETLIRALTAVAQGERIPHPEAHGFIREAVRNRSIRNKISARDFHIIKMLAEGALISEIADEVKLSMSGAYNARARIMNRLNLKDPRDVRKFALGLGLVPPEV
jgi:two-component system, NarL family, invasion response regulator UvrY